MTVFPGKKLTVIVDFEVGGEPVSPSLASYIVRSTTGIVQNSTVITVPAGATEVYVIVPDTLHVLNTGEKYRQLRVEVSYTANNGVFEQDYVYYVIPDLFLGFDGVVARQVLGVSQEDLPDEPDYGRAYIDLATGPIGTTFYNALMGADTDLAATARQLIFYQALMNLLPRLQLTLFKSLESETSKVTRFTVNLDSVRSAVEARYAFYYSELKTISDGFSPIPTLIILDSPTDAITGQ